jgi:hypothetical protein
MNHLTIALTCALLLSGCASDYRRCVDNLTEGALRDNPTPTATERKEATMKASRSCSDFMD